MEKKSKEKNKTEQEGSKKLVPTRGRIFEGVVIRKFPKRITIVLERTVKIPKYERFMKKTTRIHARLPDEMDVEVGDLVRIQECRPLSKTIHFLTIKKVKSKEEM